MYFRLIQGKLTRKTPGSAGWDIHSTVDIIINPGEQGLIPTGIISEFSPELVATIWDRSGLAVKFRFNTRAGVIDSDYDKEWGVVAVNEGKEPFIVKVGDRIAQVLLFETADWNITFQGEGFVNDYETRQGGFGSTGTV